MYSYVPDSNFQLDVFGLHLNTNGATGNFGVYEIKTNGDLHKIGKTDLNRVTKSSGNPTRIHQQIIKLEKIHGKGNVTAEVVEKGFKTTADAKAVEAARLQKHFDDTGEILEGNKKSFKPSCN